MDDGVGAYTYTVIDTNTADLTLVLFRAPISNE